MKTEKIQVIMDMSPTIRELRSIDKKIAQTSKNLTAILAVIVAKSFAQIGKPAVNVNVYVSLADQSMRHLMMEGKLREDLLINEVRQITSSLDKNTEKILSKLDAAGQHIQKPEFNGTSEKKSPIKELMKGIAANAVFDILKKGGESLTLIATSPIGMATLLGGSLVGSALAEDYYRYLKKEEGKPIRFQRLWDSANFTEDEKRAFLKHYEPIKFSVEDAVAKTNEADPFKQYSIGTDPSRSGEADTAYFRKWVEDLMSKIKAADPFKQYSIGTDPSRSGEADLSSFHQFLEKIRNMPNHYDPDSPYPMSEYGAISSLSDAYDSRTYNTPRQSVATNLSTDRRNMFHTDNVVIHTQSNDPKAVRREIDSWMQRQCRILVENSDSPFIA